MTTPPSSGVMTLHQALLGPSIGDREYGVIATSGLELSQRQAGALSAYIFGARRSIRNVPEVYFAFFPLDARTDPLWALCVTEVRQMGESWVVFADAILLSQAELNHIHWAVHRLALSWRERPAVSAKSVPLHQFNLAALAANLAEVAPRAGLSRKFRSDFSKPGARVAAQVADGLSPNYALASLWEALPVYVRYRRTWVTNPFLVWTPVNRSEGAFDLVVGPEAGGWAAQYPLAIKFGKSGIVLPPDQQRPWHETYDAAEAYLLASPDLRRLPGDVPEPEPLEPNAVAAYTTLTHQYTTTTEDVFGVLARLAQFAAITRSRSQVDDAQLQIVRGAVEREFNRRLPAAEPLAAIGAIDLYVRDIGPSLNRLNPVYMAGQAAHAKVYFALAADTAKQLHRAALSREGAPLLPSLKALIEEPQVLLSAPALEVIAEETAAALAASPAPPVAEFARALLHRVGSDSRVAIDDWAFEALSVSIARLDSFRSITQMMTAWRDAGRADREKRKGIARRLNSVVKILQGKYPDPIEALHQDWCGEEDYYARISATLAAVPDSDWDQDLFEPPLPVQIR